MHLYLIPMLLLPTYFSYRINIKRECDWDIFHCDKPFDEDLSSVLRCNHDDCPVNYECCSHKCFKHNICQPYKYPVLTSESPPLNHKTHQGRCNIIVSCDFQLSEAFSKQFECLYDSDCAENYKCCYVDCYKHKLCQPAGNENMMIRADISNNLQTTSVVSAATTQIPFKSKIQPAGPSSKDGPAKRGSVTFMVAQEGTKLLSTILFPTRATITTKEDADEYNDGTDYNINFENSGYRPTELKVHTFVPTTDRTTQVLFASKFEPTISIDATVKTLTDDEGDDDFDFDASGDILPEALFTQLPKWTKTWSELHKQGEQYSNRVNSTAEEHKYNEAGSGNINSPQKTAEHYSSQPPFDDNGNGDEDNNFENRSELHKQREQYSNRVNSTAEEHKYNEAGNNNFNSPQETAEYYSNKPLFDDNGSGDDDDNFENRSELHKQREQYSNRVNSPAEEHKYNEAGDGNFNSPQKIAEHYANQSPLDDNGSGDDDDNFENSGYSPDELEIVSVVSKAEKEFSSNAYDVISRTMQPTTATLIKTDYGSTWDQGISAENFTEVNILITNPQKATVKEYLSPKNTHGSLPLVHFHTESTKSINDDADDIIFESSGDDSDQTQVINTVEHVKIKVMSHENTEKISEEAERITTTKDVEKEIEDRIIFENSGEILTETEVQPTTVPKGTTISAEATATTLVDVDSETDEFSFENSGNGPIEIIVIPHVRNYTEYKLTKTVLSNTIDEIDEVITTPPHLNVKPIHQIKEGSYHDNDSNLLRLNITFIANGQPMNAVNFITNAQPARRNAIALSEQSLVGKEDTSTEIVKTAKVNDDNESDIIFTNNEHNLEGTDQFVFTSNQRTAEHIFTEYPQNYLLKLKPTVNPLTKEVDGNDGSSFTKNDDSLIRIEEPLTSITERTVNYIKTTRATTNTDSTETNYEFNTEYGNSRISENTETQESKQLKNTDEEYVTSEINLNREEYKSTVLANEISEYYSEDGKNGGIENNSEKMTNLSVINETAENVSVVQSSAHIDMITKEVEPQVITESLNNFKTELVTLQTSINSQKYRNTDPVDKMYENSFENAEYENVDSKEQKMNPHVSKEIAEATESTVESSGYTEIAMFKVQDTTESFRNANTEHMISKVGINIQENEVTASIDEISGKFFENKESKKLKNADEEYVTSEMSLHREEYKNMVLADEMSEYYSEDSKNGGIENNSVQITKPGVVNEIAKNMSVLQSVAPTSIIMKEVEPQVTESLNNFEIMLIMLETSTSSQRYKNTFPVDKIYESSFEDAEYENLNSKEQKMNLHVSKEISEATELTVEPSGYTGIATLKVQDITESFTNANAGHKISKVGINIQESKASPSVDKISGKFFESEETENLYNDDKSNKFYNALEEYEKATSFKLQPSGYREALPLKMAEHTDSIDENDDDSFSSGDIQKEFDYYDYIY